MLRLFAVLIGLAALIQVSACAAGPSGSSAVPRTSTKPAAAPNAQYCAQNRDPKCPNGSYQGTHVVLDPKAGYWDATGAPVNGGPMGADGSTRNNLTQEFCARNETPGCPVGSYVAPNAIKNPDGSPTYVTCEGAICTNPNHGAADPGSGQPAESPDTDRSNDVPAPDPDTRIGGGSPIDAPEPEQSPDVGRTDPPSPTVDEPDFDQP